MGVTMKPTTGPTIVKSRTVRCYWTLALGWGWGNKKPAFSMRYAGFDMRWCGLLQGIGVRPESNLSMRNINIFLKVPRKIPTRLGVFNRS
jgi:hypothetical protein